MRYRDRDFVLVDESHNFRNTNTQRYRVLEAFLAQGRRCVLLTATPRNKTAWDIYNQLKLFHQPDQTNLPIDPPNLYQFFRLIENGDRSLPALLSNILIRRTRNHIVRWYGYDSETNQPVDPDSFAAYTSGERQAYVMVAGQPNYFPKRQLETIQYSIEETYRGLYQQLRAYMGAANESGEEATDSDSLCYARYGLWQYVRPEKQNQPPYSELQRAGINLRGLMRVSMFKRLESSVHAFRETIARQLTINRAFIAALDEGVVAAGEDAQTLLYESDRYEEDDLLQQLQIVTGRYNIDDFDADALRRDVQHDIRILETILSIVDQITPEHDDKLQTLISVLLQLQLDSSKCLIFTQFADTARYLYEQLQAIDQWVDIEVIFSDRTRKSSVIGRFAPRANPNFRPSGDQPEINLLIATDVLSEGLNLQDCDKVINYDLHWNPVRLIQRFGRIDRIGSEHDEIFGFNFLPETALDEHLGLRDKLSSRIQEIHNTIGEDAAVLEPTEQLNEDAMYAIYEGRDISEFDEDGYEEYLNLEEAEEIIRQLQRDQPDEFERLMRLRDGIRCARHDPEQATFVFCRAGAYQQLYLIDVHGETITREVPYILGRLRCEASEQPIQLPESHNALVTATKRNFEGEARSRRAESQRVLTLTRGQKYILRELRLFHSMTQDEAILAQVQALESVFRQALPKVVQSQLNEIRTQNLSGEFLLGRLLQINERHNLSEISQTPTFSAEGADETPMIVCSQVFRIE